MFINKMVVVLDIVPLSKLKQGLVVEVFEAPLVDIRICLEEVTDLL